MSRDFRDRADSYSTHSAPLWKVFAAGFTVGVIFLGVVWIGVGRKDGEKPREANIRQYVPPPDVVEEVEAAPFAAPGPEFSYPEMLVKQEVVTPVDEQPIHPAEPPPAAAPLAPAAPAPAPAPLVPDRSTDGFMLQVAALKTPTDAENLKTRLAALGLPAQIQAATVKGERFCRVRVGPYRGTDQLEQHRSRLRSSGYSADVVRLK